MELALRWFEGGLRAEHTVATPLVDVVVVVVKEVSVLVIVEVGAGAVEVVWACVTVKASFKVA